ncbi:MAG TPA: MotA/TolQ/ExbB proton channel family protein, partial [Bacteroidales bacterium]|nr:MotA/TolQ/ExbB proton channel family protein [Bacteroidales bacterium]
MNLLLLLQSVAGDSLPDLTALAEGVETSQRMNFFDMAVKGGWMMIPLLLLSLVAVYIFIERLIALNKASKENPNFMERIKDYIYDGNIDSAIKLCKQAD